MISIPDEFDNEISELRRLQMVLCDRGYIASLRQCERMYEQYSDSLAASWIMFSDNDSDDELWERIEGWVYRARRRADGSPE